MNEYENLLNDMMMKDVFKNIDQLTKEMMERNEKALKRIEERRAMI